MTQVKGVVVAAGYGSRFLPATKTVPKEMLPLIDKPAIHFIIEEFLQAGIRDILIITSRRKKVLDDYFDREAELEAVFLNDGKPEKLQRIKPPEANVYFVRQQEMKGTGQALLLAKAFTGNDPFIVAYPDDIIFSKTSLSAQLIQAWRETGNSVLAVKDLGDAPVDRYGVVDPKDASVNPCTVNRLVEKPAPGQEPSKLVSYGRYLFTPDLYHHLEEGLAKHTGGEYYHVGAINALAAEGRLSALDFEGMRLDTGEPMGYLEAICRYALNREDLKDEAAALFHKLSQ